MELYYLSKSPFSKGTTTIQQAIDDYPEMISQSRSSRTVKTYATGLLAFAAALKKAKLDPETTDVAQLKEDSIKLFIKALRGKADTTQSLYLTGATTLYTYLLAENLSRRRDN